MKGLLYFESIMSNPYNYLFWEIVSYALESTVEVAELWTVFHEHYSLLGQSSIMGCCISEHLSEGIFLISCLFFKLHSFHCVHNSMSKVTKADCKN